MENVTWFRERERAHERGERQRGKESETDSTLSGEPNTGLDPPL